MEIKYRNSATSNERQNEFPELRKPCMRDEFLQIKLTSTRKSQQTYRSIN